MGYNVKDDRAGFGDIVKGFLRRLVKFIVLVIVFCGVLFGLFYFLYQQFPEVEKALDQLIGFFRPIYEQYGVWAVLGVIIFIIAAVWALGDELRRKERRKEMMREYMR